MSHANMTQGKTSVTAVSYTLKQIRFFENRWEAGCYLEVVFTSS